MIKEIIFYVVLVLVFLCAAKSHGRQHRLERELEGHWNVSFTSINHPWVERFWFRQRIVYWSIASITAGAMIARQLKKHRKNQKWGWTLFVFRLAAGSMIVAFMGTGFWSMIRLFLKLAENIPVPGNEWLRDAIWGSIGWWLLTISLLSFLLLIRLTIYEKQPREI